MNILKITADKAYINFETDLTEGELFVRAFSPCMDAQTPIGEYTLSVCERSARLSRIIGGRDGAFLRYEARNENETFGGKQFVEELLFEPLRSYDYPVCDTKKGLQVGMIDDAISLGVKHAAQNLCIGDYLVSSEGEDTEEYIFEGKTYHFDKKSIERSDKRIKQLTDAGIIVTFILLSAKHWVKDTPEDMKSILLHPGYIPYLDAPEAHVSAFNLVTDEGVRHYAAFVSFITERYTREDAKYGRAAGLIVGNEVNSPWYWGNAGLMSMEKYTDEYLRVLRLTWQIATSICKSIRIYISLDHFFNGACGDCNPQKFYHGKAMLEYLNQTACKEGNFGWNIAYHPYPEDLSKPDFWNDTTATDNEDTIRITFKNLHLLPKFLNRKELLYKDKPRRIILSEQGFHSFKNPQSEVLQAFAYGRAYRICMEIPEIDSFILHAHCDNKFEFGLNLGLWRRNEKTDEPDSTKPIYDIFKAIDKKDETGDYFWKRF